MESIYSFQQEYVPGDWIYRGEYVWRNKETFEIVAIREGTMREIENKEDCYRVVKLVRGGVETVLDNISKEKAKNVVEDYLENGEIPDDSWLSDEKGDSIE